MASKELVGRPLVPFFDSDENVNAALELADDAHETLDVDARVWDKELGYFVYPSERSEPVAIKTRESRTDSGKLLLTPSMMLSSSAPERASSIVPPAAAEVPRSSSTKRGAKKKSRADTPVRRRAKDDDKAPKKGKKQSNGKQKAQPSSDKWAWSAFQSSPDPAQLPMPPFLTKPEIATGNGQVDAAAPPLPPTPPPPMHHQAVPVAPPLPPGQPPLPPGQPPLPAGQPPLPPGQPPLPMGQPPLPSGQPPLPPGQPPLPPEVTAAPAMSIELSMTQDLRRMLNIGGG